MLFLHRLPTIFLLIFLSLVGCPASAIETGKVSLEQAVHLFQTKNFDEAKKAFVALQADSPMQAEYAYNIGMCEMNLGHNGMALAWFRRAMAQNPLYAEAHHASDFLQRKMNIANVSHKIIYFETFRGLIINRVPSMIVHAATLLFCFFAAMSVLKLLGRRRLARQEELEPPSIQWTTVATLAIFIVSFAVSCAYLYESQQVRATIVGTSTSVLTTPEKSGAILVELGEGMEVLIKRTTDEWTQVKVPGGPTGWIESKNLFQTTPENRPEK